MIFFVQNEPETKNLACLGYYENKIQQHEQMYTDCLIHVGVMNQLIRLRLCLTCRSNGKASPSSHTDGPPLNELSWLDDGPLNEDEFQKCLAMLRVPEQSIIYSTPPHPIVVTGERERSRVYLYTLPSVENDGVSSPRSHKSWEKNSFPLTL